MVLGDLELHILQSEWGSFGLGPGIFTGPKKEEECDGDHIGYGIGTGVVRHRPGEVKNVLDHLDGDRLDTVGRWVFLLVPSELALETELDVADLVEPGVVGPHCRERLAN